MTKIDALLREIDLPQRSRAGSLELLAVFDKPDPLEGPYFEETIFTTPSRLPADVVAAVVRTTADACAALGLREGPVHAELRTDDERVWMLELAARSVGGLCSRSTDETGTSTWCGVGWTGQPNVIPKRNGTTELRFGAFDRAYHFLDAGTGLRLRPTLPTGDLAKGSATSDPDGYPLYYAGSRDDRLRIVALDRGRPTVLWSLDANTSVEERISISFNIMFSSFTENLSKPLW